jgi:hypothetical protein
MPSPEDSTLTEERAPGRASNQYLAPLIFRINPAVAEICRAPGAARAGKVLAWLGVQQSTAFGTRIGILESIDILRNPTKLDCLTLRFC